MVEVTLHYMVSNSCGGESSIATFVQKLRATTVNEYLYTSTGQCPAYCEIVHRLKECNLNEFLTVHCQFILFPSPAQILSIRIFFKTNLIVIMSKFQSYAEIEYYWIPLIGTIFLE
jgi:hypothetical protein